MFKKIIIVLPAYNAEKTLGRTYAEIPEELFKEIILVDDASQDQTVEVAKKLGIKMIRHQFNLGYGANQKTCYREALKEKADIIVMLHPDYQYDPKKIPDLIKPIVEGEADMVFGSRISGGALSGGMPFWKYLANRFLTVFENLVLKEKLSEYHSGFRAYRADVFNNISYQHNSDNFVFDAQIIIQLKAKSYRIKEIPIKARYFADASSVNFRQSFQYGFGIIFYLGQYFLYKLGVRKFLWLE